MEMTDVSAPIPVIDIRGDSDVALATFTAEPRRLKALLDSGRRTYTAIGLRIADELTRFWADGNESPYAAEVAKLARALGRPGAFLLNYSYEWGCTTGACDDPREGGSILLRTLDWPFDGLGRNVILALQRGPCRGLCECHLARFCRGADGNCARAFRGRD